jgi:uncharacterized cupin superfamily protein
MPKLDLSQIAPQAGSTYPEPFASQMEGRSYLRLGQAAGLTQFGANIVILQPGAMSSQRHWHLKEDEFVIMLSGECVMVLDGGETVMRPGDAAAFPAGLADGHHFINRSSEEARFLVVGSKSPEEVCTYSDVDLHLTVAGGGYQYSHKDGTPYPKKGS